jgi:hypothetical protein
VAAALAAGERVLKLDLDGYSLQTKGTVQESVAAEQAALVE